MSGVLAAVRFLVDHNFNDHILTGFLALDTSIDVIRTSDVGLAQVPDEDLLEWAAAAGRVILTHDEHTMIGFAYNRVTAGTPMPGVVLVHQWAPVKRAIDDVLYLAQAGVPADFDGRVIHVPLPP
jgi:predicted nuclease of predicted toxin-antitoxin system